MKTRIIYGLVALVVILIVALLVYNQNQEQNLETLNSQSQSSKVGSNSSNASQDQGSLILEEETELQQGQFSDEGSLSGNIAVHKISFDGASFSPNAITIKRGDVVVFTNDSNRSFWPASAEHPTHTLYPEFDAKAKLDSGSIYEFKFVKVGEWGFHDHVTPSAFGKITVLE